MPLPALIVLSDLALIVLVVVEVMPAPTTVYADAAPALRRRSVLRREEHPFVPGGRRAAEREPEQWSAIASPAPEQESEPDRPPRPTWAPLPASQAPARRGRHSDEESDDAPRRDTPRRRGAYAA